MQVRVSHIIVQAVAAVIGLITHSHDIHRKLEMQAIYTCQMSSLNRVALKECYLEPFIVLV